MLTKLFKQGIHFKCVGSKCIDSCCTGWDITFDQETYETLSQDPYYKNIMDQYASINDNISMPNINYGIINLTDDGKCPFLDMDHLCHIQKNGSENDLSTVCALYPRYYNMVDGIYEESLSLACIEAAEQLLLGDYLEVTEANREPKRDVVLQGVNTKTDAPCLDDFRKSVFDVLRSQHHTFDEKLGILMTFHKHIEHTNDDELKNVLKNYDFTSIEKSIDIDKVTHNKLINFLNKVGQSEHTELDQLIYACIHESSYENLNFDKGSSIDKIMSNYLMHQMFKDLYPFIATHNKMDSFQYLLKKVQILRLLIMCDGHFEAKRVARIIQMYSKGLEHHGAFHYEIEQLIL